MNVQAWVHAYPLALVFLIPAYVALVMWTISRLSGWSLLARRFHANGPFCGETWGWQSARFRGWCSYNHCLTFGASPEGLHMAVMLPFRLVQPPLLIPWREIEVEAGKVFFGFYDSAQFRIGTEERVTVKVYGKLVDRLRRAAGPGWPLYQIEQMEARTRG